MYKACGNSMYNLGFACAQFAGISAAYSGNVHPVGKQLSYAQASRQLSARLVRKLSTVFNLLKTYLSLLSTHLTTSTTTYINTYLRKA